MPAFVATLRSRDPTAARALEFLILCASRSGEVLGASWEEIDVKEATWTLPPNQMKAGAEHVVTLTPRALEILAEMRIDREKPSGVIFTNPQSRRKLPGLSKTAMFALLKRMDAAFTAHGFRSAFKDWALNETEFADEISEEALAHTVGSQVRRAYRRSVALDRRRKLMETWADYVGSAAVKGEESADRE